MTTQVFDVIDKILSKQIDRQEALQSFESLSEQEKDQLLAQIRDKVTGEKVPGEDKAESEGEAPDALGPDTLSSVYELSLTDEHKEYIAQLTIDYENYVPKSKGNALKHQAYFVDQRKTAGLKNSLKSVQFQLTYEKADGPYIYDIDGNQYVDLAGDNGVNLFGHQAPFLKKALAKRLDLGYPTVGYSEDLFQAAEKFSRITGHERTVFTQSGTEAVMWSVRIARAANMKKKIVIFDGSYHGLSDAVFAFKDRKGNSMAPGLGMLQEFADLIMILDYGDISQLKILEEQADDIACVLCEPVQSRFPQRQPKEFVKELRKVTIEQNIVLIFDEMITGLRACCRGAEGFYNVKPDIGVYGKIPGGGMPTGVIAGAAKYMDLVDGGTWSFDDDSMPKLRRTSMAGTHTQNPMKISACLAVLTELENRCHDSGNCTYEDCFLSELNDKTEKLAIELNEYFKEKHVPLIVDYFSSLFRIRVIDDEFGLVRELLIVLLKMNGVETSTSGNNFLTTAHSDDDIRRVINATKASIETLIEKNFFYQAEPEQEVESTATTTEPAKAAPERLVASDVQVSENVGNDQVHMLKNLLIADMQKFQSGGA